MQGPIGRRGFLRGAGVGMAAAALSCRAIHAAGAPPGVASPLLFHSPPMRPYVDDLPVLPVVRGDRLDLAAASTTHRFHRDFGEVPALGYGGESYLGPTVEHRVDEPLTVRFANTLGPHPFSADIDTSMHGVAESYRTKPPCSLHLHGGVTPPDSDGHPQQSTFPGQHRTYRFPLRQPAAHLWYHDHAMGITRANVYAGLAGTVLLRDEFDTGEPGNPLGLPAGEFELPLLLQEKLFTADGRQNLRSTLVVPQSAWEGGAVGDVGVVNGAVWPRCEVARGLYRFRVLNGASFSLWNLFFGNHMRFWVIGTDHGLLDAPVEVRSVKLAPGERIDLLVDFSRLAPGESVELCNDEPPVFQAAILGEVAMPRFCRFVAGGARGFTGPVPDRLRGGPGLPPALPPLEIPAAVRTLTVSQPYELRVPPAIMSLNNLTFDSPEIEMPRQGTVEQWNIVNITPDPHPIHLHLVNFRILGRAPLRTVDYQAADPQPPIGVKWTPPAEDFLAGPQQPPAAWEAGRKDIVRADGGTVTRIIVRFPTADELGFDPDAPFSGSSHDHAHDAAELQGYIWHCHLLDHEDHDMMLRYRVVRE
ncbi:FtsP/CotA-like multicopper oxidase with cupredoxin domain [Nocardia transvalensis]|uniref:FtsP/CotA-like multicopper oxidase with cupredoxin domain n=1 Tax=Nocardia transvalensis TaxID=37333 RepID=A0A7W9PKP9_9NOCA|nr:multicopper oxidase domain-containing protein [Nocardia transvalensis]MBB5917811.1 FtsP/CotA-like multicopper oxidase with cupredoxin domain [Nocardia transvalensis]